ncbi:MAG TPA: SLC13 family permease [Methanomassiliicoccales archaeon]|nr:SLC13 family permease [Methanomassiliicoccales archaeon]
MDTASWLALIVFVATYVLISIRRFRWFNIDRPAVAMLGAALMIVLGVVTPQEAIAAIDLNILALLLGMMLLVSALQLCGFFTWVSLRIIGRSKNQFEFLVLVMLATAILSALILNDAVVLLFTPIVIQTCRLINANPIPFLVAEAVSANIGSVATEVGNPQNVYIAAQSGISFVDFSAKLLPVAAISIFVALVLIWIAFRKDLKLDDTEAKARKLFPREVSRPIDCEAARCKIDFEGMHKSVYIVLGVMAVVFVGFVLSSVIGMPLSIIAIVGGTVVLFALPLFNRRATAKSIVGGVDWTLLLFFVGLFIVLKGVEVSGLMNEMVSVFESTGEGLTSVAGLTAFSGILSNLISNVPAVMLLSPFLVMIGSTTLWLTLAASSTLAGNATILGAAANVIVAENGEKMGVELSFWKFVKAGFPITIVTLLVSIVLLSI